MIAHQLALALRRYDDLYREQRPKISLLQLIVLRQLEEGPIPSGEVAARCGLDAQATRDILHRLLKRKFVRRAKKDTVLTLLGCGAMQEGKAAMIKVEEVILCQVTPSWKKHFTDVLQAMTTS